MIVIACWAIAVAATTMFGLILAVSEAAARAAAPALLTLAIPAWLYLTIHDERNRRDPRR